MIQVFADGECVYDSRDARYSLSELKSTTGLNIAGTASLTMPPGYPAYNRFVSLRTIVTIYRDGNLRFRGRVLYPDDTKYNDRTIMCEGELCLLRDGVARPRSFHDTPANIFVALMEEYNAQVEDFKRFTPGEITVAEGGTPSDGRINGTVNTYGDVLNIRSGPGTGYSVIGQLRPGTRVAVLETTSGGWGRITQGWVYMDYVILDAESNGQYDFEIGEAQKTLAAVQKLQERFGGYITFTDASDGSRQINWKSSIDRKSTQEITLGENLLDFSKNETAAVDVATGIFPYGAKNSTTGKRLTIESVNGGLDYILAEDAKYIRGTIMTTQTWDDVTDAETLLKKAQAFLAGCKNVIASLELSAVDLSLIDKSLDSFQLGDTIHVSSPPHGVDDDFQLIELPEDHLSPEKSRITLGKEIPSLTGQFLY